MPTRWITFLLAFIFLAYTVVRVTSNLPSISKPRELADTVSYLRISREPLSAGDFWGDARPFVFPLLIKIAGQDVSLTSALQLGFSITAWGLLALSITASLQTSWLKLLSFGILLALSLVRHLAGWDYVMMTESLSVSWFVVFLALGIWLSLEWKIYKVIALIFAGFFLAFTRDTNAYLLLMLAGLLIISTMFRWSKPRTLQLAVPLLLIFLLNHFTSELGARWIFPLNNIVGRRILPNTQALEYFQSCGMPVTPELLALTNEYANGQNRAFYNDPALEGYRIWMGEHGKPCYMKWLLSDPVNSIRSSLEQFEGLILFEKISNFFARRYDPILPYYMEPFFYPVKLIPAIWFALTLSALAAIWKQAWKLNPLWGIYILLCLPILPHLFITWHGDAMAPERHALSVGLQLALCFWLFIFLFFDQFAAQWNGKNE